MAEQKLLVKREGDFHYPIYFKNDFQDLAGAIREEGLENRKICIVTDSHVCLLYTSDYIEPKRDKAPNLAIVRKLAFQDLDECMYKILGDTLAYLEENPKDIDNATKDAFLYYRDLHMKRQS